MDEAIDVLTDFSRYYMYIYAHRKEATEIYKQLEKSVRFDQGANVTRTLFKIIWILFLLLSVASIIGV